MIYNFVFEGGCMDGADVLADCAQSDAAPSPAAPWIDCTLGGAVGLTFPVPDPEGLESVGQTAGQPCQSHQGPRPDSIGVVYRDQHAGTVIVRCRHVPWIELASEGTKWIVFTFEGGFKDGATEICPITWGG